MRQTIPPPLPDAERKNIFLYHFKNFLTKALEFPDAFFLDEDFRWHPTTVDFQGKKFQVVIKDDVTEVEGVAHAYYRHPFTAPCASTPLPRRWKFMELPRPMEIHA